MKRFHSAPQFYRVFSRAFILAAISYVALTVSPASSRAATLVVTNLAISGPGTLRTLLPTAHNGDVITFAVTGTITNILSTGLIISNNLSIVGPGSNLLTITGTNWFAAFQVTGGATSSVSGLTFYQCNTTIYNSGNLSVSNCVFSNNHGGNGGVSGLNGGSGFPANGGAAIFNSGTLTAANCQFLNNIGGAGGFGTPVPAYGFYGAGAYTTGGNGASGGNGGAVYDTGTASFTNCTFGWNSAGRGGVGGTGASGSSYNGIPSQMTAGPGFRGGNGGDGGNGGAVYTLNGGKFVSCTFFGNTAGTGGSGGDGGNGNYYGVYSGGVGGNAGNAGSGTIYSTGACQLVACTFYNNAAGTGGSGGNGGNAGSTVIASAQGGGGGSGGNAGKGGSGGALFAPTNSNFTLQNILIAQDSIGYAGSPGSGGAGGPGGVIYGTNGNSGASAADGSGPDLSGFFTSRGHNLVSLSDGSIGFTNNLRSDIVGTGTAIDAMISSLADNHGPVYTCALLPGSPALDVGDDALLLSPTNLATDARGYARKSGAHVDIGAYEYQLPVLPLKFNCTFTSDGPQLFFTNTPGATFTLLGSTDFTLPVENWDVLGQPDEIAPGQFRWTDLDYGNYDFRFFMLRSP